MEKTLLEGIQAGVKKRDYRFTLHAGDRMTEGHISVRETEEALLSSDAEMIEDYPEDRRGLSCLILGITGGRRPLHIQCTYPPNVVVITAYEPKAEEWIDWKVRKGGKG
ncbi:MAG: DUF4258 domain-containing protein [Chloroflexi bacterium]|nr:DUF4258 domain-containing protein [Chloroflexota bacterium]